MRVLVILFTFFLSKTCYSFSMEEIYKNLDITTFNSSFLRKVPEGKKHFSDVLSLPKPKMTDSDIVMERKSWIYVLTVHKQKSNGDIHICFTDHAYQGNYDSQQPMIIRRYGDKYIALGLYSDVCEEYAR